MHKNYLKTATRNFIKFFILFIGLYWLCGCNRLMAQTVNKGQVVYGCDRSLPDSGLIADETEIVYLKTQIKITTWNGEISEMLDNLPYKTKIERVNKEGRRYDYYFRKQDQPILAEWIQKLKQ